MTSHLAEIKSSRDLTEKLIGSISKERRQEIFAPNIIITNEDHMIIPEEYQDIPVTRDKMDFSAIDWTKRTQQYMENWEYGHYAPNEIPFPKPGWHAYDFQAPIIDHILQYSDYKDRTGRYVHIGPKFFALEIHRQAGKDEMLIIIEVAANLFRPGIYWHTFNEYQQAKKVLVTGGRFTKIVPKELIASINQTELVLTLKNGGIVQMLGLDSNIDKKRGVTIDGMFNSEWAYTKDQTIYGAVKSTLDTTDGMVGFVSTPCGEDDFADKVDLAKDKMLNGTEKEKAYYFGATYTVEDTGIVSPERIQQFVQENAYRGIERAVLRAEVEYYCSRAAGNVSGIFAPEMKHIYENRLIDFHQPDENGSCYPDLNYPIHTAADLALPGSAHQGNTKNHDEAVIFSFQIIPDYEHGFHHMICLDYYAKKKADVPELISEFIRKPRIHPQTGETYDYHWTPPGFAGTESYCIVPQDARYLVVGTNLKGVLEWFQQYGIRAKWLGKLTQEQMTVGTYLARHWLQHYVWMDVNMNKPKTGDGKQTFYKALQNTVTEYDPVKDIEIPVHDRNSHFSHSFIHSIIGIHEVYKDLEPEDPELKLAGQIKMVAPGKYVKYGTKQSIKQYKEMHNAKAINIR